MIGTVFPIIESKTAMSHEMPQDFFAEDDAKEYTETLDCDYEMESTEGEIV